MASTTATLTSGDPALRRSYSLPTRDNSELLLDSNEAAAAAAAAATSKNNYHKNSNNTNSTSSSFGPLRHSKSEDIQQQHKLDRYGFILNMDSHGNLQHDDDNHHHHHHGASNNNINAGNGYSRNGGGVGGDQATAAAAASSRKNGNKNSNRNNSSNNINNNNNNNQQNDSQQQHGDPKYQMAAGALTDAQTATIQRRVKKWEAMLSKWPSSSAFSSNRNTRKRKLVKKRLRKGIPDEKRGTVWPVLCQIDQKIQQHPGLYKQLVEQSVGRNSTSSGGVRDDDLNHTRNTNTGTSTSTSTSNRSNSSKQEEENNVNKVASPMSNIEAQIAKPREAASSAQQQQQPQFIAKRANGEPITFEYSKSFKAIQDTIERDIHRTFPRHSMFYTNDDNEDDEDAADFCSDEDETAGGLLTPFNDENSAIYQTTNLCGDTTDRLRSMMLARSETITSKRSTNSKNSRLSGGGASQTTAAAQLRTSRSHLIHTGNANGDTFDPARIFDGAGGQARLRRVLKAYSTYDREIGYCQGMNFIAAMFLTLMPEERAFWMLVCKYFSGSLLL